MFWANTLTPPVPTSAPHASATGVYLEGLIEAWTLAQRLGDLRAEPYRHAILLGLRALRQLQFRHPSDMVYITRTTAFRVVCAPRPMTTRSGWTMCSMA